MFAYLMVFQWLAGIAAALWISPKTWLGTQSHVHLHVWAAIYVGGIITSLPVLLAWKQPGRALTRHAVAIGQMLTSSLLIHLSGGRIETHFHVFGSLAFLAFYRDWRVLVSATVVVAADHFWRGVFWPQSVFGVLAASPWRWVEHAGWVVFEDIFLFLSVRQGLGEMRQVAERQASLESLHQGVELQVQERTQALQLEIQERKRAEVRLALQYDVTRMVAASRFLAESAPKVLRAICETISWDLGALWKVDAGANVLRCIEVFHTPDAELARFAEKNRDMTLSKGVGVPGRVWASGEPDWIVHLQRDANFTRAPLGAECGLQTALVFPILLGSEVVGVFEFFSREQRDREESLLSLMSNLGQQTALFFERIEAEARQERTNKELIQVSRQAGMAEVATSVLHNVGNVLNSVNVSVSLISEQVRKTKADTVAKVAALMDEHAGNLGAFMSEDPKGKQLPNFLGQLGQQLAREKAALLVETDSLAKQVDHIKDIVAMQQTYAKVSGVTEKVKVIDLAEDALRMNASALIRHDVHLFRDYDESLPEIHIEKHKALQILVNLIRNAKQACDETGSPEKQLTIRVTNGNDRVRIALKDNGVGIRPENINRIFNLGFTTKKEGHGFGLHSSCLAAREMGGSLTAHSDGPGRGATFVLELPCRAEPSKP